MKKDSEDLTISVSKRELLDKTLVKAIRSNTGVKKKDSNQRTFSHHNGTYSLSNSHHGNNHHSNNHWQQKPW